MEKYITYSCEYPSGFNNVWITLEMMLALAAVTQRKILLGDVFHYGSQTRFFTPENNIIPLSDYKSVWGVLDKTAITKNFDIEFLNINHLHENNPHYKKEFPNVSTIQIKHKFPYDEDGLTPYLFSEKSVLDSDDFTNFSCDRSAIGIDIDDGSEIISYGGFGQFFYNIYLGDKDKRNTIKKKINSSLVYKQYYTDLVKNLIPPNTYNSIHLRYAKLVGGNYGETDDFSGSYPVTPSTVLERIEKLFEKDVPLYIATDITPSSYEDGLWRNIKINDYLDIIKKKYTVITLDDFDLNLTYTENIVVDQLLCVNSSIFYGSYYSTFSKRIDILRGIEGKPTYDYMGWNKIQPSYVYKESPYPWKYLSKSIWPWYYSSYPQYMLEG